MTASQKAKELVEKFHEHSYNPNPLFNTKEEKSHDKDCALLCVDEIIQAILDCGIVAGFNLEYWYKVREVITKLKT